MACCERLTVVYYKLWHDVIFCNLMSLSVWFWYNLFQYTTLHSQGHLKMSYSLNPGIEILICSFRKKDIKEFLILPARFVWYSLIINPIQRLVRNESILTLIKEYCIVIPRVITIYLQASSIAYVFDISLYAWYIAIVPLKVD